MIRTGRVLAVSCDAPMLDRLSANVLSPDSDLERTEFAGLTAPEAHLPDDVALVLSPLVTPDFDAVELAQVLSRMFFRGRYLAIARHLPDCGIIRREVAASAPGIGFDVVPLDSSFRLHSV